LEFDPHHGFPELLTNDAWRALAERRGLSQRELEVLRLLCRGLHSPRIAAVLKIEMPTLRTHLRSIFRKMQCRGRIQAVLQALHDGDNYHRLG